jgi:hypothetical protein
VGQIDATYHHTSEIDSSNWTRTYNSGYLLAVTHLTTNLPARCLNRAEQTGSLVATCSATTKTGEMIVYGNALAEARLHDRA